MLLALASVEQAANLVDPELALVALDPALFVNLIVLLL
jgi:hypothetical protein